RQIADLLHGLRFIGKLDQVEVRIRNHHIFGLTANPAAHIDIAVRSTRATGIHIEANSRLARTTGPASTTCYVKRNRNQIADVQIFDVLSFSMISPVISCPSTSPFGAVVRPRTMCWSEPQMFVETILRITPWVISFPAGFCIFG